MTTLMRAFVCGLALAVTVFLAGWVAGCIVGPIEGEGVALVGVVWSPVAFVVGAILGATWWTGSPTGDDNEPGPRSDGTP
jgi:hypothetical protein